MHWLISTQVRALRVDDPVPKFRILPMAGQAPPDSYGHVCVGWRADALSFEKLRRDRGEELEKHAVAIPGGAALCGNQIYWRVRPESPRRPPRHRSDACSMAWRCRFLTARRNQHGRVIVEE